MLLFWLLYCKLPLPSWRVKLNSVSDSEMQLVVNVEKWCCLISGKRWGPGPFFFLARTSWRSTTVSWFQIWLLLSMESLQMLMWVVQIADRFVWSSLHRAIACLSCCLLLDWIPAELGICEQHRYRRGPGNYIILQHHVSEKLQNWSYEVNDSLLSTPK